MTSLEDFKTINRHGEPYRSPYPDGRVTETITKNQNEDYDFFTEVQRVLDARTGDPVVGEYVKHPTGYQRFTHAWEDSIQAGGGDGSFHVYPSGNCSYSGGLNSGAPYELLKLIDEKKEGTVWRFSRGRAMAHNGVYCRLDFRVFELQPCSDISKVRNLTWSFPVIPVTPEMWHYALEVLPPLAWSGKFFAMAEAYSHKDNVPTYYCFDKIGNQYYVTIDTIDQARKVFHELSTKQTVKA